MERERCWLSRVSLLFVILLFFPTGSFGAASDFSGDGKSDILWRHASGALAVWLLDGGTLIGIGSLGSAGTDWTVQGTGDFNGDGATDVLWRHTSGVVYLWLLDRTTLITAGSLGSVGKDWTIAGVGDFNGDGRTDILWRHTSGLILIWFLNGTSIIGTGSPGNAGADWSIQAVADVNGDARADIVWRHTSGAVFVWLLNGTSIIGNGSPGNAGTDWSIQRVADLDGDGNADILWRHTSGQAFVWFLHGTARIGATPLGSVDPSWTIQGALDFNADGRADILWRHSSGIVFVWLMNGASVIGTGSPGTADVSWTIQADSPQEFVLLGLNPFAAAQPTARGKRLHALEGWRGELYVGYGDYNANTGPIEIAAWDPQRRVFASKLSFQTEAVENYRAIGGRLYAPAIDPREAGQPASVAIGEVDGRWWNNGNVFFTHAYDIATLDGTDLWLVGARDHQAVAARSTDGGQTWATALTVSPQSDPDDVARFYFVFAYQGGLVVQALDSIAGAHPHSKIFVNGGWTDGPDLQPLGGVVGKPLPFAGKIVYRGRTGLTVYDGASARSTGRTASDLVVADGTLYVLGGGLVTSTQDLSTWTRVGAAPPRAVSLGILDGRLYVGTADSELYQLGAIP